MKVSWNELSIKLQNRTGIRVKDLAIQQLILLRSSHPYVC